MEELRTVVWLHGLGGSDAEWAAVREALPPARHRDALPPLGAAIVVGHSFGGVQALRLAVAAPDGVAALVLSGCFWPPARAGRSVAAATADYARHRALYLRDLGARRRAPRPSPRAAAHLASLASLGLRPRAFHRLAAQVGCPVLVIHGERDHVVPIAFARAAARAHPRWTLREVEGGGHVLHRERPREWAAIVVRWLACVESGRSAR